MRELEKAFPGNRLKPIAKICSKERR